MSVTVEAVLAQVPEWAGRRVECVPITGGLSHQVLSVRTGDQRYVLRLLDPAVSLVGLGVPMEQEIANTVLAAETGAGPRVVRVLPEHSALVLEYVDGETLSAADVPQHIEGIALACRLLHSGRAFGNEFEVFAKLAELAGLCRAHDLGLPEGFEQRQPEIDALRRALAAHPLPKVPCHNDLLAENFLAQDDRVRIVDYQLSGMNDPGFELGDIAAEAQLDPEQTERLARAYFGAELTGALVARVRLYALMSDYTWTLWFRIHHGLLPSKAGDFDYAAEAAGKWGRALAVLDGPEYGRLVAAV
ncbi:phosphotransferase family protein [Kutzneria viridogrisea]|uniref:Thiamine kinase-like enzyme n=1 Tax=Kutzneria viridogrisea TaxID=47990 RepID=A0ABR6BJK4_9PSEU|nr:thiamine kinase-like enzyme [Kutzneria viridogrisea]